jgi:hypothetical protein
MAIPRNYDNVVLLWSHIMKRDGNSYHRFLEKENRMVSHIDRKKRDIKKEVKSNIIVKYNQNGVSYAIR